MPYKIREARIENGMTQEELAEKSGVSRATISKLEQGELPSTKVDTLVRLAEALGRTVGDIFLP